MDYAKLTAVATALSLIAIGAADAARKEQRQRVRDSAPTSMSQDGTRASGSTRAGYGCHTDEGYGRWWPCGGGPK